MGISRGFSPVLCACVTLCFLFTFTCLEGTPLSISTIARTQEDLEKGMVYLKKYNYMSENMNADIVSRLIDPSEFQATIRHMQEYMGVPVTGILDDDTIAKMNQSRCGVPDPNGVNDNNSLGGRLKRFALTGGRWEARRLTYRIINAPSELQMADVRDAIDRAFKVWQKFIPRQFVEVSSNPVDIMISFGEYYHGDSYPFDGPGGTLAHAYGPTPGYGDGIEGDVHFDDSELFTSRSYEGINLFLVAAHEIGHSLGLSHSTDTTALMAPFYSGYKEVFQLPYDDILGIQTLYGARPEDPNPPPVTVKPTTAVAKTTKVPAVCGMRFDCVAHIRGEIYAFKKDRFWRVRNLGEPLTPPEGLLSASFFKDLPSGIQAAYERAYDQRILFFKGMEYYVYDGLTPLPGYPKLISNLSNILPGNLNAAATWREYNKVYFFKRGKVYRYDELLKTVDAGWPYLISEIFPGVPKGLDSAFRYSDNNGYFIKGKYYYQYSDTTRKVLDGYPRPFVADFFGCSPDLYYGNDTNGTDVGDNGDGGVNGSIGFQFSVVLYTLSLMCLSFFVSS